MFNRMSIIKWQMALVLITTLAIIPQAKSSLSCEKTFYSQEVAKVIDQNYIDDLVNNQNGRYKTIEVAVRTPILNQGSRGFCHMYSLFTELVREYMQRNNGKDPDISIHYWAYQHWLARAINTALHPENGPDVPEGGWYESTFDLIKRFGVMTTAQWKALGGKTDIETRFKNSIESPQLKVLMINTQAQVKLLDLFMNIDKTQHKLDAKEKRKRLNDLFNNPKNGYVFTNLKKLVKEKKAQLESQSTAFTAEQLNFLSDLADKRNKLSEISEVQIIAFKNALASDVKKDVENYFASMFFGQSKTPEEINRLESKIKLSKEMFPEMHQATITVTVDEANPRAGQLKFSGRQLGVSGDHFFMEAPTDMLKQVIVDEINKGNGVWIGYDHNDSFVDNSSGAMTMKGFHYSPLQPYIDRRMRDRESIYEGGHAVQLVGYIVDRKTGEVVGFKMQNSWGAEVAQGGYFTMGLDYFRAFIWRVTIRDENGTMAAAFNKARSQQTMNRTRESKPDPKPFIFDLKVLTER